MDNFIHKLEDSWGWHCFYDESSMPLIRPRLLPPTDYFLAEEDLVAEKDRFVEEAFFAEEDLIAEKYRLAPSLVETKRSWYEIDQFARTDLNGNGRLETIEVWNIFDSGIFILKVGHTSIKGKFDSPVDGFKIVDIEPEDKYKEIVVHTLGDSDDPQNLVYWYNGRTLKEMGRLVGSAYFSGNGIVLVNDETNSGNQKQKKYVLNQKSRTLEFVPQTADTLK